MSASDRLAASATPLREARKTRAAIQQPRGGEGAKRVWAHRSADHPLGSCGEFAPCRGPRSPCNTGGRRFSRPGGARRSLPAKAADEDGEEIMSPSSPK